MGKFILLSALIGIGCIPIPERAIMADSMVQHVGETKVELNDMVKEIVKIYQEHPETPVPPMLVTVLNDTLSIVDKHLLAMHNWMEAAVIDFGTPAEGSKPVLTRQEDIDTGKYKSNAKKKNLIVGIGKTLGRRAGLPIPPTPQMPTEVPYKEGAIGLVTLISGLIIKRINDGKKTAVNEKDRYKAGAMTFAKALDELKKGDETNEAKVISAATNAGKTPKEVVAGKEVYEEFKKAGHIS